MHLTVSKALNKDTTVQVSDTTMLNRITEVGYIKIISNKKAAQQLLSSLYFIHQLAE